MAKHLLSCRCGEKLVVDTGQAGEKLQCRCGEPVVVPSFREIQALPLAEAAPPPRAGSSWNPTKGIIFAAGTAIMVIAGVVALLFLRDASAFDTSDPGFLQADLEHDLQTFEEMTPSEAFRAWAQVRSKPLGPRTPPPFVENRRTVKRLRICAAIAGVASAVGLVVIVASLVIPFGSRPRVRP